MQHLFDADLEYVNDQAVEMPSDDREGEYIGSGIGRITGDRLSGTIRWSMFAVDCAYLLVRAGIQPGPGEDLCRVHPGGVIETDDGVRIRFDARGYGLRGADRTQPYLWRLTAALHFATTDPRYHWLNTTLGLWEGTFDERAGRAQYSAYGMDGTRESIAGSPAREGDAAVGSTGWGE
jgi:Protein of unknown function (DUF3237)